MKEQYMLYLLLENWAISDHIFYVIGAWLLASEETVKSLSSKLVTMQHCVHRIEHFVTSFSLGNISLFLSQKNFVEISCCFRVAITFLHQASNLTRRHVFHFAAVERARPSPPPHHASLKSSERVSPPFLFSASSDWLVSTYHLCRVCRCQNSHCRYLSPVGVTYLGRSS